MARDDTDRPACPQCGAAAVVPIVYGLPGEELAEACRRGEVVLGGCCITDDMPEWHCKACEHEWPIRDQTVATRNSWKTDPMPPERARLDCRLTVSNTDYSRLSRGLIPEEMEDKWFAYMDNDCLFLHRSWTEFCIYTVQFERVGNEWATSEIWVNRDKEQYTGADPTEDMDMLIGVLRNLLGVEVREVRPS